MNGPTLDRAMQLLVTMLSGGPQTAEDCIAMAYGFGISRGTLYRAKKSLGICSGQQENRDGQFQPVIWQLPAPLAAKSMLLASAPQRTPQHETAWPGTFTCIIGAYHGSGMIRA